MFSGSGTSIYTNIGINVIPMCFCRDISFHKCIGDRRTGAGSPDADTVIIKPENISNISIIINSFINMVI